MISGCIFTIHLTNLFPSKYPNNGTLGPEDHSDYVNLARQALFWGFLDFQVWSTVMSYFNPAYAELEGKQFRTVGRCPCKHMDIKSR